MERIQLLLCGADDVDYIAWPVTQGIPFADGVLGRGVPVRVVDDSGRPLATQARSLATWHHDRKFVKWLLVDFQADLAAGERRQLFLEYGPDVEATACSHAVNVTSSDKHHCIDFSIDTGPLKLGLSQPRFHQETTGGRNLFQRCEIADDNGWHEVFGGSQAPNLYMVDQHGNEYGSQGDGPAAQVVIEESGPLRACVCVRGHHAAAQGQRFCPYVLRLHFFAGKSEVRIHHTFVYDQEPYRIELSAIGLDLPLDLGQVTRKAIGGSGVVHDSKSAEVIEFLQAGDDAYRVMADGQPVGEGTRSSGWASLHGSRGSALVVIRNAWQEYPKGLAVGRDGIDVQVWPRSFHEPLRFTTPYVEKAVELREVGRNEEAIKRRLEEHPTAPINLKSWDPRTGADLEWLEETVARLAPGRPISHCDTGLLNGVGAAKTTEFWLCLSSSVIDDAAAGAYSRAVQEPLIAAADPAHTCATRAIGHSYHAGDPRFTDADAGLDDAINLTVVEPVERCQRYGMMEFGNLVCTHAPGPGVSYAHYRDHDPEKALRYVGTFNNEAYDMIMGVWGNFVHSGRRDHYLAAQRYSRCVADVGFIHAEPQHPDRVGLMHYHNAHYWSGPPSPSHSLISGLLTDYFFSGDRRLLDVAKENADWAVRWQEPCGVLSNRHAALHREFTGPLWSVLEVYQATWEQKYGELARRSLNWFLRTLPQPGEYPTSVYTRGDMGDEAVVDPMVAPYQCKGHPREIYPMFEIGQRLFDSRAIRDHIIAEADSIVWHEMVDRYIHRDQAIRDQMPGTRFWPVDPGKDDWYWMDAGRVWGTYRSAAGLVCLAYDLTEDPTYAAYAKHFVQHAFRRQMNKMRHLAFFDFSHAWYGSGIPRLMRIAATAMDKAPDAVAAAEAAWLERRADQGNPVYTGSGVDLTKDKMEASGIISSRPPVTLPSDADPWERKPTVSLGRLSVADHPRA